MSHPDMIETPLVTECKEAQGRPYRPNHAHRGRNLEKKRSPLRDIPYLSGGVEDRKQQLRRLKRPHQVSGPKHYTVKRKRQRERDRELIRTTSRGVKHLYTYWRNVNSPTDVSFEEWFTLRYTAFTDVRGERIVIRKYDRTKPAMLSNLYVARMYGRREVEMLFDAETIVGERSEVKTYVAPPGKMDKRRRRDNERSEQEAKPDSERSERASQTRQRT